MSLAQQLGFLYFSPLPIFSVVSYFTKLINIGRYYFFEINILTGVSSSFWSTSHSRGAFGHRIKPPGARQITPQDNPQLTFIINPEISSAFKANDLQGQWLLCLSVRWLIRRLTACTTKPGRMVPLSTLSTCGPLNGHPQEMHRIPPLRNCSGLTLHFFWSLNISYAKPDVWYKDIGRGKYWEI